jgi:hypothetical protein
LLSDTCLDHDFKHPGFRTARVKAFNGTSKDEHAIVWDVNLSIELETLGESTVFTFEEIDG